MIAALDQSIEWFSPVLGSDGAGGQTISDYASEGTTFAAVEVAPAGERLTAAGAVAPGVVLRIRIRAGADPGIRSSWRGMWRSQTFEVLAPARIAAEWITVEALILGDPS
jgi:hypothetical protein